MAQEGRASPEQIARELKTVLRAGTRPSRIIGAMAELPALAAMFRGSDGAGAPDLAILVCEGIRAAVEGLGDGPYGRATSALLGVRPASRGLLLPQRRREAAAELVIQPSTLVRHWEKGMLEDVAFELYKMYERNR